MKRVSADLPFPRSITESSRAAGAADLIRIYDGGGKRHRFGVAGVYRQRRRHLRVHERIRDHRPLGHTVVPIQRVLGKLAAVPHFL